MSILLSSFVLRIVPFALDHSTLLAQQATTQDKSFQQLQRISKLPPKKSVEEFNAVETSIPPKWKALFHYFRGAAASNMGNLPLALKDINTAYNLGLRNPDLFFARAVILLNSGFPEQALPDYSEALRQKHTNPALVYYWRSLAFAALQRWSDALKDLDKAIALKHTIPDVYRQRGDMQFNLGTMHVLLATTLNLYACSQTISIATTVEPELFFDESHGYFDESHGYVLLPYHFQALRLTRLM